MLKKIGIIIVSIAFVCIVFFMFQMANKGTTSITREELSKRVGVELTDSDTLLGIILKLHDGGCKD